VPTEWVPWDVERDPYRDWREDVGEGVDVTNRLVETMTGRPLLVLSG
jgi:hypothetical protein